MKQTEYAACALGEILIDFTPQGVNKQGQRLFAQNAGGAPGNVAAAMAKLGAKPLLWERPKTIFTADFWEQAFRLCRMKSNTVTFGGARANL